MKQIPDPTPVNLYQGLKTSNHQHITNKRHSCQWMNTNEWTPNKIPVDSDSVYAPAWFHSFCLSDFLLPFSLLSFSLCLCVRLGLECSALCVGDWGLSCRDWHPLYWWGGFPLPLSAPLSFSLPLSLFLSLFLSLVFSLSISPFFSFILFSQCHQIQQSLSLWDTMAQKFRLSHPRQVVH